MSDLHFNCQSLQNNSLNLRICLWGKMLVFHLYGSSIHDAAMKPREIISIHGRSAINTIKTCSHWAICLATSHCTHVQRHTHTHVRTHVFSTHTTSREDVSRSCWCSGIHILSPPYASSSLLAGNIPAAHVRTHTQKGDGTMITSRMGQGCKPTREPMIRPSIIVWCGKSSFSCKTGYRKPPLKYGAAQRVIVS